MAHTLFIADALENFDPKAETTYFLMAEAQRRNHRVWHADLSQLHLVNTTLQITAQEVSLAKKGASYSHHILPTQKMSLGDFEFVFLRKDPPLDMAYLHHLTFLESGLLCGPEKTPLCINHPTGIKLASEKIFPLSIPGLSPPTMVSSNLESLASFADDCGKSVVKPLNLAGGRGIFLLKKGQVDKMSLLAMATQNGQLPVMIQKYLPQAEQGDKRVLLLAGQPVGCFIRVPDKNDFRGNMHSGAKWKASQLTKRDHEIIASLSPRLESLGLHFVGLDIIGSYVTEVNVTSPMGVREINSLYKRKVEREIWDWMEGAYS